MVSISHGQTKNNNNKTISTWYMVSDVHVVMPNAYVIHSDYHRQS